MPGSSYPTRRHHRLRGYDYRTPGYYFVTICINQRLPLLGTIQDGEMTLSPAGEMVREVWEAIPQHYPGVDVDEFIVMPNHVHGIVILQDVPERTLSLPDVVHRFKSLTTHRYGAGVRAHGWPPFAGKLWQDDYYDHVIRGEIQLGEVRRYIVENPLRWHLDRENPDHM